MSSFMGPPRLEWLSRTNLQPDFQHGVLMSLLRGLAALQVVAAHLRAQFFPSLKSLPDPTWWYQVLAFFTGFAHQGVVLFFVLSGWLVGGSLLNRLGAPGVLRDYAIDRITRLWVVLIPVFLFTLLISMVTGDVQPHRPDFSVTNPYSLAAFAGNLVGLQDMLVPRFGGNFALWSLSNEIWYYVLFPLLLLPFTGRHWATRCGALGLCATLALCLDGDLLLYFAIWLMGAGLSRMRLTLTPAQRRLLLATLLAASVYFRLAGSNDILVAASFWQDAMLSLLFLAWLGSLQVPPDRRRWRTRMAERIGAFLASFSFTLYVIHVPLLVFLRHMMHKLMPARLAHGLQPDRVADLGIYLVLLLVIVALAYLFHLPFEAQTGKLRRMVRELLAWSRARPGELLGDPGAPR